MFVYELSGCGFESRCCHLNFGYGACFGQADLGNQTAIECRLPLKLVRDIVITTVLLL